MAFPSLATFYLGLFLIVIGTGLLKGNVSVIVGQLYAPEDSAPRRRASRSSTWGSTSARSSRRWCAATSASAINWHLGFGAAGVGMDARRHSARPRRQTSAMRGSHPRRRPRRRGGSAGARRRAWGRRRLAGAVVVASSAAHRLVPGRSRRRSRRRRGRILLLAIVVFFGWLFFAPDWTPDERKRSTIGVLFLAAALFWSVFEQAGSTLNLFADRSTDRGSSGCRSRAAGSSR